MNALRSCFLCACTLLLISGCSTGPTVSRDYDSETGKTIYQTRSYTVSTLSGSNIGSSKSISMQAIGQCLGQGCQRPVPWAGMPAQHGAVCVFGHWQPAPATFRAWRTNCSRRHPDHLEYQWRGGGIPKPVGGAGHQRSWAVCSGGRFSRSTQSDRNCFFGRRQYWRTVSSTWIGNTDQLSHPPTKDWGPVESTLSAALVIWIRLIAVSIR